MPPGASVGAEPVDRAIAGGSGRDGRFDPCTTGSGRWPGEPLAAVDARQVGWRSPDGSRAVRIPATARLEVLRLAVALVACSRLNAGEGSPRGAFGVRRGGKQRAWWGFPGAPWDDRGTYWRRVSYVP